MAVHYRIVQKDIDAGGSQDFQEQVKPNHTIEALTALETGGASLDNTRLEFKVDDIHQFVPHISLSALGKTQNEALPLGITKGTQMSITGTMFNDTGSAITVRMTIRIREPE